MTKTAKNVTIARASSLPGVGNITVEYAVGEPIFHFAQSPAYVSLYRTNILLTKVPVYHNWAQGVRRRKTKSSPPLPLSYLGYTFKLAFLEVEVVPVGFVIYLRS